MTARPDTSMSDAAPPEAASLAPVPCEAALPEPAPEATLPEAVSLELSLPESVPHVDGVPTVETRPASNGDAVAPINVVRYSATGSPTSASDWAAIEAPLEIRLAGEPVTTTMRTPGHDAELAAGFLLSEEIIRSRRDMGGILPCGRGIPNSSVDVLPAPGTSFDFEPRLTLTSSACGLCGRQLLERLARGRAPLTHSASIPAATVAGLTQGLREQQPSFERTGGTHAAGLARSDGRFYCIREDVGRHNAVDKAIGRAVLDDTLHRHRFSLVVSARASFEIVHKAWLAGITLVVAVSAPSSLAIEVAQRARITLVGFARHGGFNVYSHASRIA